MKRKLFQNFKYEGLYSVNIDWFTIALHYVYLYYQLYRNKLPSKLPSVYLNGNNHFTTYLNYPKNFGLTLYSCFRMFIQSHLFFQLSGNTQLFLNFYVSKFVKTENCWDSLPEGHVLVEFHINLSFGSGCVHS